MAENAMVTTPDDKPTNEVKQAACLECRRIKTKCIKLLDAESCKRCTARGAECIVPSYHIGRYKGIKNKRSGLEKAIHQVEQAVKRARTSGEVLDDEHEVALKRLFGEAKIGETHKIADVSYEDEQGQPQSSDPHTDEVGTDFAALENGANEGEPAQHMFAHAAVDEVTINNAGNPLELLAIASSIPEDAAAPSPSTVVRASPNDHSTGGTQSSSSIEQTTQHFFSPISTRLDIGPQHDPIELGLITLMEAQSLFD